MRAVIRAICEFSLVRQYANRRIELSNVHDSASVANCTVSDVLRDDFEEGFSISVWGRNVDFCKTSADIRRQIFFANVSSRVHAGKKAEFRVARNRFE